MWSTHKVLVRLTSYILKTGKGMENKTYHTKKDSVFSPYIRAQSSLPEFTIKAVSMGILFGILFGAANAYLGLRAGLTISTSIPVAVLTVALLKAFQVIFRSKGSILEANISQTVGSASSSVASGVIFTLPALFMWGSPPTLVQMTLLAAMGGLLGVLMMVPLRRYLIVQEHENLPYPEGTACAQVLIASESRGGRAHNVLYGLGIGALAKFLTGWIRTIPGKFHIKIPFLPKGELGTEVSAALVGVGYILGPRIGAIMVGGGLLSWLVIIPLIALWGGHRPEPLYPETLLPIGDMTASQIWNRYIRYIGAGAVATGGLITLIRSIPTMIESFRIGVRQMRERVKQKSYSPVRTEDDLSLKFVGIGVLILIGFMTFHPQIFSALPNIPSRAVAAGLVALFAFFFVTVSSRIVGLVGVTSNPTSGMTIATLIGTSSLFLLLGWTDMTGKVAALTIGCVVAIAASIAGDTSQDLKTGYLVGATPKYQQIGELIGVLSAVVFVCLAVILLDKTYHFGSEELPAPQATLMKLVIEGVLERTLPWILIGIGIGIALLAEVFRIPSLPFAVGVYLPVSTMIPVFLGGLLRWWLEKRSSDDQTLLERREQGILFGSGLVGGEGILGVGIAGVAFFTSRPPAGLGIQWTPALEIVIGAVALALLLWVFRIFSQRRG